MGKLYEEWKLHKKRGFKELPKLPEPPPCRKIDLNSSKMASVFMVLVITLGIIGIFVGLAKLVNTL
jgi:hypothetical protein